MIDWNEPIEYVYMIDCSLKIVFLCLIGPENSRKFSLTLKVPQQHTDNHSGKKYRMNDKEKTVLVFFNFYCKYVLPGL